MRSEAEPTRPVGPNELGGDNREPLGLPASQEDTHQEPTDPVPSTPREDGDPVEQRMTRPQRT